MLDELVRCSIVFMKLVGLRGMTKSATGLDTVQESGGGASVDLIPRKSQVGKVWTWVGSRVGLVTAWEPPQFDTSARTRQSGAERSFPSQTQGSGESPSFSEVRVTGQREVPLRGVTRPENQCFPSRLPALPGSRLDSWLCVQRGLLWLPGYQGSCIVQSRGVPSCGGQNPLCSSRSPSWLAGSKGRASPWPAARWLLALIHALTPSLPTGAAT